jgi:hypothetical protein
LSSRWRGSGSRGSVDERLSHEPEPRRNAWRCIVRQRGTEIRTVSIRAWADLNTDPAVDAFSPVPVRTRLPSGENVTAVT